MPEMGGVEATTMIRHLEAVTGRHTPIIALTAHAMKNDRERYLASGMDGYVSKPIRPEELLREIDKWTSGVQSAAMEAVEARAATASSQA